MLLIGLTGSIATGKSTVSSMLSSQPYNLPIIDADILARKVVEPGTRGYEAIVKHFGPTTPELLVEPSDKMPENGPDGKGRPLNRPALGRRVFGDSEERKKDRSVLNHIVHPAVRWEMFKSVVGYYFRGHWAVVLDIPLLFESGLDKLCGVAAVVAVHDPAIQMQRLRARDPHLSAEDAENRVRSQTDVREKAQRCEERGEGKGIVLWNDGSREDLHEQLDKAIKGLKRENPDWWTWLLLGCPPLAVAVATWRFWQNLIINERWEEKKLQAKLSDAKPLWIVDPNNSEKKLDKDRFSHMMNKKWKRITKEGVSEAEIQAYECIVNTIRTQDIQEIGDVPLPSSWAEVTALKILFPDDFFASNYAAVAQQKFPKANIGQWNPNEQGPTPASGWKKNKYRLERANTVEAVQENSVLPKRARSSDTAEEVEEADSPFKKRRLASPIPIGDTITKPVTPQQETLPPPPSTEPQLATEGSDDSDDSNDFWSEFDEHLAPIRKAAKEGSEITSRMLNKLRKAHLMELKKQRTDELIKKMTKKHAQELRQVRSRYEGVITTWLKGIANGVKVLQKTRHELSLVEKSVK